MEQNLILEACVETCEEAIKAQKNGAHRIELCSHLDLDGLTPEKDLIKQVIEKMNIPVMVMIRPRARDFIYNADELSIMKDGIQFCKQVGAQGVVFGILDKNNTLQYKQIEMLAEQAFPL